MFRKRWTVDHKRREADFEAYYEQQGIRLEKLD